jgi:hypothetical protein
MRQRKDWEDLRADIENIVRENNIAPSDFKPLSIHDEWHTIEQGIYHTFCKLHHRVCKLNCVIYLNYKMHQGIPAQFSEV